MMRGRQVTGVLVAAILAGGCAAVEQRSWDVERVPEGSRLTIERDIPVSTYSGHAHVQAGESVDPRSVDRFQPSCRFHTKGPRDAVGVIAPGEFEVSGVRTRRAVALHDGDEPVRVASRFSREGGLPSYIRHETHMRLRSADQPAVHRMVCRYETASRAPHLQFDEIRDTLAGIATLERP